MKTDRKSDQQGELHESPEQVQKEDTMKQEFSSQDGLTQQTDTGMVLIQTDTNTSVTEQGQQEDSMKQESRSRKRKMQAKMKEIDKKKRVQDCC